MDSLTTHSNFTLLIHTTAFKPVPCQFNDVTPSSSAKDIIDIKGAKIDCLSLFMCPLQAQHKIGFFSFFAAAVYITNEENTRR
jgi:hypothetical protein